jgi:CheY-like chemotaxis protein
MTNQALNILLVDDDDVSAESVMRSLGKSGVDFPVVLAENGVVALDILRGRHPESQVCDPYVILLDLNMPRMNGFEFLTELRKDSELSSAVVFVLTTSDIPADIVRAYQENIAGYMVKSAVGPQFMRLVNFLEKYREANSFPIAV